MGAVYRSVYGWGHRSVEILSLLPWDASVNKKIETRLNNTSRTPFLMATTLLGLIIIATITETTFAKRPEFLNSLNTSLIGTVNNELAYYLD